jgi:EAL domain-containing protein (putative c-di-GMP-specific phosphodiesterase class I)
LPESRLKLIEGRNIKALAEGIENKEDLKYVVKEGIDLVQGYYFAKPAEGLVSLDLENLML